ncbi:universal stress protein [Agromyces sp. MMS24-K17]|uniref:universal stress protein n=1 Tax=Agromyces sp. MMS24-K17 TaxID=3372850 RepID=UPI003754B18F
MTTDPYRVVVGYTANEAGADALALGARIARAAEALLEVVMVLPNEAHNALVPTEQGYERLLKAQSREWLAEASTAIGHDVEQALHIRYAESFAEGLIAAAHEFDAGLIVIGAARGGLLGRMRIGTVANELLHSSDVPVVLAPAGARDEPISTGVTRITAALGTRPGATALLDTALELVDATHAPLRLLSLVSIDLPDGLDPVLAALTGDVHADRVLDDARSRLPYGVEATAQVVRGDRIEDAVGDLDWHHGELVLVGSSRLAAPNRLFLGSTAAKMLHELPVPMVVVPRSLT